MKILKIRFENIHSLKGEHEVDFGKGVLAEAGLFAITGPTGSGKSTLLDVITLALYDNIARIGKLTTSTVEDDGGIMTRNMKSCFAEVTYRVKGIVYRSHWSVERNRNNNLNPRKLELVEADTGNILASGISDTPKSNTEIIGLTYDQFVKAMVLAQSEFSKLLQANRNDRNKLLEDITGARSYREIGRAVFYKFRGIQNDIQLKEANLEGIELLSPEIIAEKKKELEALNTSKPEIEKAYQIASENIKTRQELTAKESEQKVLESEKLKLKKDYKIFNPFKTELTLHERLSKYSENLRNFDALNRDLNNLFEESGKLQKDIPLAEKEQETHLESVSKLIKDEVKIENANEKLEVFRNKIVGIQAEENKIKSESTLYQNQLNNYVRNINQSGYNLTKADNLRDFKTQFESFQTKVLESLANTGLKTLEELNEKLELQRISYEKSGNLLSLKEQIDKLNARLNEQKSKLKSEEKSLLEDSKKVDTLSTEIKTLKKEVDSLEKEIELQRKHQSLEQYREQLVPDEPCPLCGSLEHPYALEKPHFDTKEELLKEKKDSLKTKSELTLTLGEKNKYLTKSIDEIRSEIDTTSKEVDLDNKTLIALSNELNWDPNESLENLKAQRIKLIESIQKLERSKQAFQVHSILKDVEVSLKNWEDSTTAYNSLKEQRSALFKGDDINSISNALNSKITSSIASISALKNQILQNKTKAKAVSNEVSDREEELKSIVEKEQLESLEALRKSIISEERANKIRKRQNELSELKTRISEKENSLIKAIEELKAKDDASVSIETLTLNFQASKERNEELLLNIGRITNSLEKDKKDRNRHQEVLNKINSLKKDLALWKTMNDLIGDASGNKFSNFVQDLTLEQLIGFANKRLSEFNDRYLLDIPTAKEAEKSDTLKILDKYMGDARRSVRTLSGGETFLVSLAMAFALSDIAARNVKIESLFIDEGFGTLDPETLDQAITILEKMQNEGDKSVGVISHVSALKERITTQIKLDKSSLGYSTLEVVQ